MKSWGQVLVLLIGTAPQCTMILMEENDLGPIFSSSPAGLAGCRPLKYLDLVHLSFRVRVQIGAAYSSLGRTKVFNVTSVVLAGAKAKFQQRKRGVLVPLDDFSEMC